MKKLFFAILFLFASISTSLAQDITIEDIWTNYKFYAPNVSGFRFLSDGESYTQKEGNTIVQYNIKTGEQTQILFDGANYIEEDGFDGTIDSYSFSDSEGQILLTSHKESLYRHSYYAYYYVFNQKNNEITPIRKGDKIRSATLSPAGNKIAYVFENDIYIQNLKNNKTTRVTTDGKKNEIINGLADWVYEEELGIIRAFEWNEDGSAIAFIRFDESDVPEFTMTSYHGDMYPTYTTFKYPKVGEVNSDVSVHVYQVEKEKQYRISIMEDFEYIPRIKWTLETNELLIYTLNRHQNHLQIILHNTNDKSNELFLEEKSKYYVAIHDNMKWLPGKNQFLWTSEKDGYNHIYLYNKKGKEVAQLTEGEYEVTKFQGYDEKRNRVCYQAATKNPMEREVYCVDLDGNKKITIADKPGTNDVQFSRTYDYFVWKHSTINSPPTASVHTIKGKEIRPLIDNQRVSNLMSEYETSNIDFMQIPVSGTELNAYMIKPADFDSNKKYPLFMYVYGGPGSQTVIDSWQGQNYWWFQSLVKKGYIVVSVDNRGTGLRGEEFTKMTYQQMGKYETEDQINAAKYFGEMEYVDENRIGIFGWSYGGYMSSLCITKGADVFKAAIAVAPVTNWKWYDTVYTERYMRTEKENPNGYADNSPINFAGLLEGNYLLIHGISDDNVHFQNSAEMANALIREGKQFDTYVYPNRNHSIYGDGARFHLYSKMTEFLEENL